MPVSLGDLGLNPPISNVIAAVESLKCSQGFGLFHLDIDLLRISFVFNSAFVVVVCLFWCFFTAHIYFAFFSCENT